MANVSVGLGGWAVVLAMAVPGLAWTRPWKGITPGKSMRAEVTERFGAPAKEGQAQGDCAELLSYRTSDDAPASPALSGVKQAHFCIGKEGKVVHIDVFPDATLDDLTVEEAYGDEFRKKLTDDFVVYWHYERDGLVVFFDKDARRVKALKFVEGKPAAKKKGAKPEIPDAGGE
jgi:hypothetical protein